MEMEMEHEVDDVRDANRWTGPKDSEWTQDG